MIIIGAVFNFVLFVAFMVAAYFWVEHIFKVINKELNKE